MQVPEVLFHIKEALEKSDFETLKREAHSLKSSSATLGVVQVQEACRLIEDEISLENKPSIEKLKLFVNKLELSAAPSLEELKLVMQREG